MKQPYLNRARTWRGRPSEEETRAALAAQTPIEASSRRLTFGTRPPTRDVRAEPLPLQIDDDGLARQVQSAPTADQAWRALGLPGGRDAISPDAVEALAVAVTALCATSDSIGKGLKAFGALAEDAEVPVPWVDRMVELHLAELEGYWALDDLAYAGLVEGGWTVTQPDRDPPVDDPAARVMRRAEWQAEGMKAPPRGQVLAIDRLRNTLSREESIDLDRGAAGVEAVKAAGRGLVAGVALWRFANWQQTRGTR